ncbi:hypothetical protein [Deinococcus cellulosilyticus]|uniref:Uncharacterized protein n=1 Tax=Deinococcus cellulosilyticus (strain DSM 18568 / NBRC 106333 / KACC 11606 / 5516J-15) TaxID=1223518 RepID=A0A511MVN0_DEIC1|nr:hypothetical protein [Deinococcus cellulosilyticus]GEM44635.1 hypothetical protein DC3_02700 [Deinococcus cellulosilyticus NBRC 106333 = KACC 11606]
MKAKKFVSKRKNKILWVILGLALVVFLIPPASILRTIIYLPEASFPYRQQHIGSNHSYHFKNPLISKTLIILQKRSMNNWQLIVLNPEFSPKALGCFSDGWCNSLVGRVLVRTSPDKTGLSLDGPASSWNPEK